MSDFIYKNNKTQAISFPLGGIGTGSVGLGGNGRFCDVEIFNRPDKGTHAGFTHLAVKAENESAVLDTRVLQSDFIGGEMGSLERRRFRGFGFGPDRESMAGMPHFERCEFVGKFPTARLDFFDGDFPGAVSLTAFNPFIPTDEFNSSLPAAFFEVNVTNDTDTTLTYSVAFSCCNYYATRFAHAPIHEAVDTADKKGVFLGCKCPTNSLEYGDLTVLCDALDTSVQQYWYRGKWFDSLTTFWRDFTTVGPIKNRVYTEESKQDSSYDDNVATIVGRIVLKPGENSSVRFVMAWNMPLMNHRWQMTDGKKTPEEEQRIRDTTWKNYYATVFENSLTTAVYSMNNFEKLQQKTELFRDALYNSSLTHGCLDAIASNLSVLKSPTCLRLEDGSFYGFEGAQAHEGSCEGTCTHVWSYAQAVAFLFPNLERSARTLEYEYSTDENGNMGFRLQLPLGRKSNFRPCVDGQYGTIIRTYREFLLSGDIKWLSSIWGKVKKAIDYAWSDDNEDRWDLEQSGVITGRQHHTLDMELFGANPWLTGMYLCGLKAGAKLAEIVGDHESSELYCSIFERGKRQLNDTLFNGEYFIQKIDLTDSDLLSTYDGCATLNGDTAFDAYWNSEENEIKYQIANGCSIDQLLGQWHSDILGLGEIFDREKIISSLRAIYKYNYKDNLRNYANPSRIYAMNDEAGLVICAYPDKADEPIIPITYAQEMMTGFEYQAASHMIHYGMEKEGLLCVDNIRFRYDGEKRNPWNEFECGSNYARSMSSYALLIFESGFLCNAHEHMIRFAPKKHGSYFWSMHSAWGNVSITENSLVIDVLHGELTLKSVETNFKNIKSVTLSEKQIDFTPCAKGIILKRSIVIKEDVTLCLLS